MNIVSLFAQGFLLGLALSPTCLGVCLPLLVPYFGAEKRQLTTNWKAFVFFLAGRLVGYSLMGIIAGWLGQEIILQVQAAQQLESIVFLLIGLLLISFAAVKSFPHWSFCRFLNKNIICDRTPGVMGVLTGINICPPFVAALFDAAQTGGPGGGALVLIAFFLGTSLILLPLPMVGLLAKEEAMQVAGRIAAGLVGGWFCLKGLVLLV